MKRKIGILLLVSFLLVGCKSKTYGTALNWDEFNKTNKDYHVVFTSNEYSCYSDGSLYGELSYKVWLSRYKNKYNK